MSSVDVDDLRTDLALANLARAALAKRVRSLEAQLQRAHAERVLRTSLNTERSTTINHETPQANDYNTHEILIALREQTELTTQLVDKLNDIRQTLDAVAYRLLLHVSTPEKPPNGWLTRAEADGETK